MKSSKNLLFGLVFATISSALVISASVIVLSFLSSHSRARPLSLAIAVTGLVITALVFWRLLATPATQLRRLLLGTGALLLVAAGISTAYGRVTYSRFGFTVYGLIPIPALDVTVDSRGLLWFRGKTHRITLEELKPLLDESVRTVVIGNGWNSVARVDDPVLKLQGYDVRVLPTPEAFALFNQLIDEGKPVVLLAHTTC